MCETPNKDVHCSVTFFTCRSGLIDQKGVHRTLVELGTGGVVRGKKGSWVATGGQLLLSKVKGVAPRIFRFHNNRC